MYLVYKTLAEINHLNVWPKNHLSSPHFITDLTSLKLMLHSLYQLVLRCWWHIRFPRALSEKQSSRYRCHVHTSTCHSFCLGIFFFIIDF